MTRLLLVDDNVIHRKLSEKLFSPFGETVVVGSGAEAVEIFDQELAAERAFDVVILDMLMPGMDGMETLRQMRSLEKLKGLTPDQQTKILISSHDTDPELQKQAEIEGCNRYYPKKISKEGVAAMLGEFGIKPVA